jgi:ABC-type sugar transport system substrate-binding protein
MAAAILIGWAVDGSAAAERTYLVNPKSIGPAYWTAFQKGVDQAAKDLKVTVIFNAPTEADSSKQINLLQDMLNRNLTGIAISANDPAAVIPVIKKARESNIPVITFDSDAPASARQYFVGPSTDEDKGEKMAKYLGEALGGKGEVAFMVGGFSSKNQIDASKAAGDYLKVHFPDIKLVTTLSSDDDSQRAFANAQSLLQAYPNLSGIIGFAGNEIPAAAEVVEQAIKAGTVKPGQIKLTGLVVPSLINKHLKSHTLDRAFLWDVVKLGYTTVYVLDQVVQGKRITDGMDVPTVGKVKVDGPNIYIGTIEITRENVDSFSF